jgi:hypothetical protein
VTDVDDRASHHRPTFPPHSPIHSLLEAVSKTSAHTVKPAFHGPYTRFPSLPWHRAITWRTNSLNFWPALVSPDLWAFNPFIKFQVFLCYLGCAILHTTKPCFKVVLVGKARVKDHYLNSVRASTHPICFEAQAAMEPSRSSCLPQLSPPGYLKTHDASKNAKPAK